MTQPVYQEGNERAWWWKVAKHLDEAQLASVNAMSHNLDDQTPVFAFQDKLREAQAILLEIFRWKGLLPVVTNGTPEAPPEALPEAPPAAPPVIQSSPSVVDEDPAPPTLADTEEASSVTVDTESPPP